MVSLSRSIYHLSPEDYKLDFAEEGSRERIILTYSYKNPVYPKV
jgi:hypothetical protein